MDAAQFGREDRSVRPCMLGRNALCRRGSLRRPRFAFSVLLVLTLGWSGTSCADGEGGSAGPNPSSGISTRPSPSPGQTQTESETTSLPPSSAVVARGKWGGDHVTLDLHASGGVAEFDCAAGEVKEPLRLDRQGGFEAIGTYTPDPGGPVQSGDEEPAGVSARYVGRVDGSRMSLTVFLPDLGTRHGPFQLVQGDPGTPESCL